MVDVISNSTIKIIAKMIFTLWLMNENETENKHFLPHPKNKKKKSFRLEAESNGLLYYHIYNYQLFVLSQFLCSIT